MFVDEVAKLCEPCPVFRICLWLLGFVKKLFCLSISVTIRFTAEPATKPLMPLCFADFLAWALLWFFFSAMAWNAWPELFTEVLDVYLISNSALKICFALIEERDAC